MTTYSRARTQPTRGRSSSTTRLLRRGRIFTSECNSVEERTARIIEYVRERELEYGREPGSVRVMAVTKHQEPSRIARSLASGIALVGENRVQELRDKLPFFRTEGVETHLIGHLQSNKIKYVVGQVDCIESVDSLELAGLISRRALALGCVQDIMLEVNIGADPGKWGLEPHEVEDCLERAAALENLRVKGLMTILPRCEESECEKLFAAMYKLFVDIINKKIDNVSMNFLSMGMSGDYRLALKHGANIIRLGSAIFG